MLRLVFTMLAGSLLGCAAAAGSNPAREPFEPPELVDGSADLADSLRLQGRLGFDVGDVAARFPQRGMLGWEIAGRAGARLEIAVRSAESNPAVVVYGPRQGASWNRPPTVGWNDDDPAGGTTDSFLDVTLPLDGVYAVVVLERAAPSDVARELTLRVACPDGGCAMPCDGSCPEGFGCGEALACEPRSLDVDLDALITWAEGADAIVRGTVVDVGVASVPDADYPRAPARCARDVDRMATVRLREVVSGAPYGGDLVTVVTVSAGTLNPGDEAWLMLADCGAASGFVGAEVATLDAAQDQPAMREALSRVASFVEEQALREHLLGADAVIVGTAGTVKELADGVFETTVTVRELVHGLTSAAVVVRFAPDDGHQLREGQDALLVLRPDVTTGMGPGAYGLFDPRDVWPAADGDRMRSLLAEPAARPSLP